MATLDEQIQEKRRQEGRPIPPICPDGITRRKQQGRLRPSDLEYYEKKAEYDIALRYWINPDYDKYEAEWSQSDYKEMYTLLQFIDQYEKIKWLEKRDQLSYDFVKEEILKIFVEITGWKYVPSEESEKFIKLLIDYFFLTEKRTNPIESDLMVSDIKLGGTALKVPLHTNKGLMILGITGVAKSTLVECIKTFQSDPDKLFLDIKGQEYPCRYFKNEILNITIVSARELNRIEETEKEYYLKLQSVSNLFIDDVLSEDKSYGKWILADFLEERYKNKRRTHIIANYEEDMTVEGVLNAMALRYGKRVDSRQFEMFNLVALKDKDKRLKKYQNG